MAKEIIYVVEDEVNIQQLIKYNLEANGYSVKIFEDGESLLKECQTTFPDLFLLDLMLPGIDGIEVCKRLKLDPKTNNIPIFMITAKSDEVDKVIGLEIGADDYITKPFGIRELIARIKGIFRRIKNSNIDNNNEKVVCGNINIDFSRREVYKNGNLVEMPLKEFELLKLLIQNKGKVLSREMLLEKIWGFDYCGETRTVDVHIRYLRQKIEDDDGNPVYIETSRGVGYKFKGI